MIVVATISYIYLNYKAEYELAKKENIQFESYYEQEIYGTDLVTLLNKAIDNNEKNGVAKDKKGNYVENHENSIKIAIKSTDDDAIHSMEEIYRGGTNLFMRFYNQIKFKCTKIEYHDFNHKVKYLLFEQITE